MIIKKNDRFVKKFYCDFTEFKVKIFSLEEWEKLSEEAQRGCIEYSVTFKPMTWGEHGKLRGDCQRMNVETNQQLFDYDKYQIEKLVRVIQDWNLFRMDEEGVKQPIDPTPDAIKKLHPLIGTHMLDLYTDEIEMEKEVEKK